MLHIPLSGLEPDPVLGHESDATDVLQATARGVLAGVELKREGLVQPDQRQDCFLDGEPAESTSAAQHVEQHTGLGVERSCASREKGEGAQQHTTHNASTPAGWLLLG